MAIGDQGRLRVAPRRVGMGRIQLLAGALVLGPGFWMAFPAHVSAAECDPGPCFLRGDANLDGYVDVADVLYLLNNLFRGSDPLSCLEAGNFNAVDPVDLTDAVYLLLHLYLGGSAPPAPFPGCGPAPGDCGDYPASLCAGGPVRREDPTLHLAFDGPLVLEGAPGEKVAATAAVTLDNSFVGAPPVDGWNLSLRTVPVETLTIEGLSTEG